MLDVVSNRDSNEEIDVIPVRRVQRLSKINANIAYITNSNRMWPVTTNLKIDAAMKGDEAYDWKWEAGERLVGEINNAHPIPTY